MYPIISYSQYLYSIKEGLIRTNNIESIYEKLQGNLQELGIDTEIRIQNKFTYEIQVKNYYWLVEEIPEKLQIQKSLIEINNQLGFYPTWISYVISKNPQYYPFRIRFTLDNLIKILQESQLYELRIIFESEYDDGDYKNNILVPLKAYYFNAGYRLNKKISRDLSSSEESRPPFHEDRIYLFPDLKDSLEVLKKLERHHGSIFELYEIDLSEKMIFHTDPDFPWGFYTYDSIPGERIRFFKESHQLQNI